MADTAKINVEVTSTGAKELTQEAQKTHAAYKGIEQTSAGISKNLANAAAKSTRTPNPVRAAKGAATLENQEYNMGRGVAGATGAAGRDFAQQAQGLGGLVHLYATFAANIFAASAAFMALSRAMDTTNMIKGLDQLGAATGRNLGYMSKALVAVTDGAVSLREAMEAVAKSSAAGMSNDQITRMGVAAKNASQALGLSMPDALSRLSRGISKIEPELLDELGIFVRVDDAVAQYARTVGKAASTVTDYEKRQAFANAVLTQAEEKFKAIKIDANPYTKLAASMSNALQQGLELLNKVITPLANILATSPTALVTALALVVSTLVKQAIPTITSFRSNLAKSAEAANSAAVAIAEQRKKNFEIRDDKKLTALNNRYKELTASATVLQETLKKDIEGNMFRRPTAFLNKFAEDLRQVTEKDILSAQRRLSTLQGRLSIEGPVEPKRQRQADEYKKEYDALKQIIPVLKERYKVDLEAEKEASKTTAGRYSAHALNVEKIIKLQQKAVSAGIISNAAENAATYGTIAAWKLLGEEVSRARAGYKQVGDQFVEVGSRMGATRAAITGVKGAFVAAATHAGMLAQSIMGNLMPVLGMLGLAYAGLDYLLSKNGKEVAAFNSQIDALNSSTKTLADTTELYINKQLSSEAIMAKANAFGEMSNSINKTVEALKKADATASEFDKFIDGFLGVIGKGLQQKTSKELAFSISTALESLPNNLRESTAIDLAKVLGVDTNTLQDIDKLSKALENIPINQVIVKFKEVGTVVEKANQSNKKQALGLDELKNKTTALKRANEDLMQSFINRDPTSNFAIALIDTLNVFRQNLEKVDKQFLNSTTSWEVWWKEGIEGAENSKEVFKDSSTYIAEQLTLITGILDAPGLDTFYSPEQILQLKDFGFQLRDIKKSLESVMAAEDGVAKAAGIARKEFEKSIQSMPSLDSRSIDRQLIGTNLTSSYDIKELTAMSGALSIRKQEIEKAAAEGLSQVRGIFKDFSKTLEEGYALIFKSISNAYEKVKIDVAKQAVSFISGPGTGAQTAELEKRSIQLQIDNIETMDRLINVNHMSTLALEKSNALREKENLEKTAPEKRTTKQKTELADIEAKTVAIDQASEVLNNFSKGAFESLSDLAKKFLPLSIVIQKANKQAQVIELKGAKQVADVKGQQATANEQIAVNDKIRQSALDIFNIERDRIKNLTTLIGLSTEELNDLLYSYEIQSASLQNANQQATLTEKIWAAEKNRLNLSGEALNNENQKIDQLKKERDDVEKIGQERIKNLETEKAISAIKISTSSKLKDLEQAAELRKALDSIKNAQIDLDNTRLNSMKSMGMIEEQYLLKLKLANSLRTLEAEKVEKLAEAEEARARSILDISSKAAQARAQAESKTYAKPQDREDTLRAIANDEKEKIDRINASYKIYADSLDVVNSKKILGVKLLAEAEEYTRAWEQSFRDVASVAVSLSVILGDMGSKIGLAIEGFVKLGKTVYENAKAEEALRSKINDLKDNTAPGDAASDAAQQLEAAEAALAKQRRKSAKDSITLYAAEVGAVKNLFKEKTTAYKVFGATEKALHVAKMAMIAEDMAADLMANSSAIATMAKEAAAALGLMTAEGGAAITKQAASGDSYTAFARAAAMAAFVAAIISAYGGSSAGATVPSSMTSAGRQEVQGTGQKWEGESKVSTGFGVLGDPTEKINNIDKSLEIIRDKSINFLPIFNSMESLLVSIDKGINKTALAIYTANIGKSVQGYNSSSPSKLGGLIGGSSEEVIDFGIRFGEKAGTTFMNLVRGEEMFKYSTVKWQDKGSLWGLIGGGEGVNENLDKLNNKITASLGQIFENAVLTFEDVAKYLGSSINVRGLLEELQLDESVYLSLKDLKGEDLVTELSAVVGQIINEATLSLFAFAEDYNKFGEDIFTTIVRIVDTNQKVSYSLNNIGIDFESSLDTVVYETRDIIERFVIGYTEAFIDPNLLFSAAMSGFEITPEQLPVYGEKVIGSETVAVTKTIKEQSIAITESLVELAGGMEEFAKGINFYMDNFLTADEKRTILTKNVTTEVSRLSTEYAGLIDAPLDSIENFKKVIQGLGDDLSTTAGQELYTSLMNLAPAFYELYKATEEGSSSIQSLTLQLMKYQNMDAAILYERTNALKELTTQEEKDLQTQIWAYEDLAKTRKLDIDLLRAEGRTFEALTEARRDEWATLTAAEQTIKWRIWATEDANKSQSLELRLMKLKGQATQALNIERDKELLTLSNIVDASGKSDRMRQEEIWQLEDAAKLRGAEIELLNAQGLAAQALTLTREAELEGLTEELRIKKLLVYAAQDAATTQGLYIGYLQATGQAWKATELERQKALDAASDKKKPGELSDRDILDMTYRAQDAAKLRDLEIEKLNALGASYDALLLTRDKELEGLSTAEKAIKRQIYVLQDLQKTIDLSVRLAGLGGNNDLAIAIERMRELMAASPFDREILNSIYALEDLQKVRALEAELVEAQGYGYNALILSRKAELRTLTAAERAIKKQVYAAQDSLKTYNLQIQLMRVMGNETGALAAERELELRNLSETDQAIQRLIWEYEDQTEASDKLKDSLKSVTESIKGSIKSLKDYKTALMLSEESPYTTAIQYDLAKNSIYDLLQIISTPAETEEQLAAQASAVAALESTTTTFLELSRKLYASSPTYTEDFNWVLSILDTATGSLEKQLTDAEKQLAAIETGNAYLASLDSTATQLLAIASTPVDYGTDESGASYFSKNPDVAAAYALDTYGLTPDEFAVTHYNKYGAEEGRDAPDTATYMSAMYSTMENIGVAIPAGILEATTALSNDITSAMNIKTEELRYASANVENAIYTTNDVNTGLFQEMIAEIKRLGEKVLQLEATTAQVGLLNVEATNANTAELGGTIIDAASATAYAAQLQNRAVIV